VWSDTKNDAAMIRWWNGVSAVLDLSNPEAVDWFNQQLCNLQKNYGVDGFKFDAGDTAFYIPEQGGSYRSFAPRTPEQHTMDFAAIGLNFPFNEYRACWRQAGMPLAQRLRDKDHSWVALQELIPGIITQGLLGYSFTCPDLIGGGLASAFSDPRKFDPELVVRSAQVHALMPMMQFSVAPWRVLPTEMAQYCLDAAKLHSKFGGEILAKAQDAARTGEPIVRSLSWSWPGLGYEPVTDQFMIGEDLMVAPVVEKGVRQRSIVFPPGKWLGFKGETITGPSHQMVAAPLSELHYYRLMR
jgi:alpha-glucosidase